MQVVSQHLTLQLNQDNYDQVFNVYLDNQSREMVVNLYHDGVAYIPDSADTAELWITFKTGEVTKIPGQVVSGQVKVLLTETSTAIPGLAECRIVMINGTQQLSSGAFTMAIGESIASDIELLKKDYSDVRLAALAIQQLIADESEIRTDIITKHEETFSAAQAVQPWKPTVSSSGDLSWAQSTDLTPPTAQNIKGPKGDPGDTGSQGPKGDPGDLGPQNLITNGTGLMGDNTNFPNFNFTSADAAGGASGSFYKNHAGASATIMSEEFIPIDTTKNYLFEFYAKQDSTTPATYYSFLAPFDVDKKPIEAFHVSYVPNTTTTLTQDLKDGDTVVHFESLANWDITTISPSRKGFIFWNYKNSGGYQYPIGVYSRNSWGSLYTDGSSVDKNANTITLTVPWDKGTFPAGTSVSQRTFGETYMYGILNEPFPSEWTYYSFIYGPSQESMRLKFWGGIAYAKIGFLWNWNKVSDGRGYVSNIKFFGVYYASQADLNNTTTTANNALSMANAAQTGVTDVNNNLINNYSTTAQMHSAINQKADSITQSVSETYATVSHNHDSSYAAANHSHGQLVQQGSTTDTVAFKIVTQAEYDALTPAANVIYFITETP